MPTLFLFTWKIFFVIAFQAFSLYFVIYKSFECQQNEKKIHSIDFTFYIFSCQISIWNWVCFFVKLTHSKKMLEELTKKRTNYSWKQSYPLIACWTTRNSKKHQQTMSAITILLKICPMNSLNVVELFCAVHASYVFSFWI